MAMMPKRVKYRKHQRGSIRGKATRGNFVAFGDYGLQVLEPGWLKANVIEAGRVAATHFLRREGKLWVRVFPSKSISHKPLEQRMGKGKAEPVAWVAVVKPGTILYELGGVTESQARTAMARVAMKLPFRCRFVTRRPRL
ncbi:MAG: 50S ribosomal protein L16 [Planctomycetia bacterium]|nr:50S ribosomal protein L16 [Planctomycetia bacterium]